MVPSVPVTSPKSRLKLEPRITIVPSSLAVTLRAVSPPEIMKFEKSFAAKLPVEKSPPETVKVELPLELKLANEFDPPETLMFESSLAVKRPDEFDPPETLMLELPLASKLTNAKDPAEKSTFESSFAITAVPRPLAELALIVPPVIDN